MDVLVIGGTRFFGKVIVRKLLERGDRVTVYSRGNARPDFWDDVAHIQGDRTQHDDFVEKLRRKTFDAVIDNVAFKVEDARAVVKAFGGRTGRYVVASTLSVYGGPGHAWEWHTVANEDRPRHLNEFVDLYARWPVPEEYVDLTRVSWDYDPDITEYAQGKRQIERYLQETPDFPSVVMRVPSTLGPEDQSGRFWWYLQRILDGREIILRDGGSSVFRPGFRDDVAQASIDAMDSPNTVGQIYNVCQAEIVTLRRFLEVMAGHAGRKLNTVSVPGDVLERLSGLSWEDWYFDFFSRPPVFVFSIEKGRLDFDMQCTPMENWVGQTVRWFMEEYDGPDSQYYDRRDEEVEFARWWRREYERFSEELAR